MWFNLVEVFYIKLFFAERLRLPFGSLRSCHSYGSDGFPWTTMACSRHCYLPQSRQFP